jgi:hypothetical protein
LQAKQYDTAGRGTAITTIKRKDEEKKFFTEFAFKGNQIRSDVYRVKNGNKGERKRAWAFNNTNSVFYYEGRNSAYIKSTKRSGDYRDLGYDFHPDTFNQWYKYSVAEMLDNMCKHGDHLTVYFDTRKLLTSRTRRIGIKGMLSKWKSKGKFPPLNVSFCVDRKLNPKRRRGRRTPKGVGGRSLPYDWGLRV